MTRVPEEKLISKISIVLLIFSMGNISSWMCRCVKEDDEITYLKCKVKF